jgi:phosphoserine aminotransferase
MNVVFNLPAELKKRVRFRRKARNGRARGHPFGGQYRASIYNAVTREWVQALVDLMQSSTVRDAMAKVLVSDSLSKQGLEVLSQASGIS